MEKNFDLVEIKRYYKKHVFERLITSNSNIIADVLKDYIFVSYRSTPTSKMCFYRHKKYEKESMILKLL